MGRRIELGLLYSRSGSYALISDACRTGALAAIAMVHADPAFDLSFVPVERDPGGNIDLYAPLCDDILRQTSARHVIGCVTSWSRKEVIPTLENAGGTLWYAVPYEGFEASDHVVYTHACPNQHLLPLLDWAFPAYGRRTYLTGSNYIWGWEMNRLARETVMAAGGQVLGERYLPIGSRDVGRMMDEVRATAPDFILNSLIGPSSYAFLAAYHALGQADARFLPQACPVLSCNMTECELPALGDAAEGLIAAGPYFRGAQTEWTGPEWTGPEWTGTERRGTEWTGTGQFGSSHEAAAFVAVVELARLLHGREGSETASLSTLLASGQSHIIDSQTHHTTLPVLIAQVRAGRFAVLERKAAVAGDPYLTRPRVDSRAPGLRPGLRVVS